MKKTRHFNVSLLFFLCLILILSCGKDSSRFDSFRDAIEFGGDFEDPNYSTSVEQTGMEEFQEGDEIWTCTTETVFVEDALGGQNGFSLFSPNADVVYPGNLIQGISLYKATPDAILADRAGGSITISVLDGNSKSTVAVDQISIDQVTQAANDIISGMDASVIPANFQFEKSIVQSEREFAFRAGADYENAWSEVSGRLSFSNNASYSRMMVKLHQTFYTMIFTAPFNIDGFFAPTADPQDLERFIGLGNPPCYISSVNYGRIFYMLIESSASESELKTAVEGSFEGLTSEGGGSVETDFFESIDEVNIKVFALGGDAATTIEAGGLTKNNLYKLNDILKRATDVRTGVPISYKVQSVKTNEVVAVPLATNYDKRSCYITSALPPPVITEHWSGIVDLLGSQVGGAVRTTAINGPGQPAPVLFFDSLGHRFVMDDGESLTGPFESIREFPGFADCPLEDIGGGASHSVRIHNINYNKMILVNKRGNKAATYYNNQWSNAVNLELIPELKYWKTEGVADLANGNNLILSVNKAGNAVHVEPYGGSTNPNILLNLPVFMFTGGFENGEVTPNKFPDGISAITRLDDNLYATIDKAGLRYMVADISNSSAVRYWGPFKL